MTISEVLNRFIDLRLRKYNFYSVLGQVVSVDTVARTCVVQPIDGAVYSDVKLQGLNGSTNGFCPIPSVDSWVIVTFFNRNQGFITAYTDLDSINSNVAQITFNNGSVGMAKTDVLVSKINELETQVNNLLTALRSVVITLAPAGTFPIAPFFSTFNPLTPTQQADIEDKTIKH